MPRYDSLFSFPTWKEEQQIIKYGRFSLMIISLILCVFLLFFFDLKFDISYFWILKINKKVSINIPYAFLLCSSLFFLYVHIEPFFLKIQRYTIPAAKLKVPSLRIAQISDTHVHYPYPQVTGKRLLEIINKINKENPDIVVFTGDLMSDDSKYSGKDIDTLINALKYLKSPLFVCFGNHDVACHNALERALTDIGAKVLEQETTQVTIKGTTIYISGIKPSLKIHETSEYIEQIKNNFTGDHNCYHILLAHMPDAADAANQAGIFDLQLSGHSHGGQCVLPFNAGTPLLPPGCKKYHGCVKQNYRVGEMILHVSRGVGVTPLPFPLIRFLCPPEISILTLVPPTL